MGYMAEITLVRTTAGRLDTVDGHVGVFSKKIESGAGKSFHGAVILRPIKGF
jgi:hypothetical protein